MFNRLQSINVFSEMSENHHIGGYVFFNPSKEKSLSSIKVSIQGLCLISLLLGYKLSLNMDECYIIMAQSIPSMSIPPTRALVRHLSSCPSGQWGFVRKPLPRLGVWHLSICLEEGNVTFLFQYFHLKI